MRRADIEHILRAAGTVTGKARFVLVGSAAVVAWRELVPDAMAISRDVDLFAYDTPDVDHVSDQLEGALGIASDFDRTFGYYCDGVGAETAVLPSDWEDRAKEFSSPNTNGVTALVPEPNDIALSKLVVWRPKDVDWLKAAVGHAIVDPRVMRSRLRALPPRAGDLGMLAVRLGALEGGP